jgi:hypothetical protein
MHFLLKFFTAASNVGHWKHLAKIRMAYLAALVDFAYSSNRVVQEPTQKKAAKALTR